MSRHVIYKLILSALNGVVYKCLTTRSRVLIYTSQFYYELWCLREICTKRHVNRYKFIKRRAYFREVATGTSVNELRGEARIGD